MVAYLIGHLSGDSGSLHGQADEGLVLVGGAFSGVGKETHPVRLEASGNPHLAAIDDQVIRTYKSISQSNKQTNSQSNKQTANQTNKQSIKQTNNQRNNQTNNQVINYSINQSVNYSIN